MGEAEYWVTDWPTVTRILGLPACAGCADRTPRVRASRPNLRQPARACSQAVDDSFIAHPLWASSIANAGWAESDSWSMGIVRLGFGAILLGRRGLFLDLSIPDDGVARLRFR